MKKINVLVILLFVICSATAQSQTDKKAAPKQDAGSQPAPEKKSPPAQDDGMNKWMAYMTPGTMHEMLAKFNGDWREDVTLWMKPGAEPTKSTSTCTNR